MPKESPTYPVLSLPTEVSVFIFREVCVGGADYRANHVQVILSQVCKSWRSTVLATPLLWTHFKHNGWTTRRPIQSSLIRAYVDRSANMLMDFTFEVDGIATGLLDILHEEVIPNISRLRRLSLCIRCNGSQFPVAVLQCFESLPMENLEVLEIYLKGSDIMRPGVLQNLPFSFSFVAPRLKMVRTDSRILHLTLPEDVTSQLTHLQIDEGCPLAISIWKPFPLLLANASSLTSLAISGKPFTIKLLSRVPLQLLTLPNLRYFGCMDDKIACNMSHMPRHDSQSFPCIRRVAFINCYPFKSNGPLRTLARATGSATSMTIANNFIPGTVTDATTDLVSFLQKSGTFDGHSELMWPDLQELSCLNPSMSEKQYDTCVNTLSSREHDFPGVKKATLRLLEKSVREFRDRIEEDIHEGYAIVEMLPFSDYTGGLSPWPTVDLFHSSAEEIFRYDLPI